MIERMSRRNQALLDQVKAGGHRRRITCSSKRRGWSSPGGAWSSRCGARPSPPWRMRHGASCGPASPPSPVPRGAGESRSGTGALLATPRPLAGEIISEQRKRFRQVRTQPLMLAEPAPATTRTETRTAQPLGRRPPAPVPPAHRWALRAPAAGLGLVGLLWFSGVAIGLVRLLGGWFVANRVGARAALIDGGPIRDTFEHMRGQTHVDHARLAVSLDVEAPVAMRVASPTVVVPRHLLDHLPPDVLAPILAHELSHVARRDYAVNLAQCVAEVLLFHSPATWWLRRAFARRASSVATTAPSRWQATARDTSRRSRSWHVLAP